MDSLGNITTDIVDPTNIFGPQRDSLYIVIPITTIYSLIFVTGILGNVFTCLVIVRNKSMHTATNYYLFSLAISDLLLLVSGMPQEMYSIWSKWPYVFGNTFCVLRGLAAETSTNASVLTITLFTIERYLAICYPFVSHKMSKLSRAVKHVMSLWVVAFGLALPQALQFGIKEANGVVMCLQTQVIVQHSFEISTFVFFLAPMVVISVLYALIGMKLRETSLGNEHKDLERNMSHTRKTIRKHCQSTRRVVKMLVAVVVAFFVCWAPFHAQRLVAIYGTTENHHARSPILLSAYYLLTYSSGIFYYLSTCINPIFYHIMSNKFRDAFKNTVKSCRRSQSTRQRCSYSAMAFGGNPTSSGNSGNSLRQEPSFRNRSRRHNHRSSQSHVCQNGRHCPGDEASYRGALNRTESTQATKDDVNNRSTSCCGNQTSPKDDVNNRSTSCCGNQTSPKDDVNNRSTSCSGNQTSPKDDVNNRSTSCCGNQTSPKDDVNNRSTSCCGSQTSPKDDVNNRSTSCCGNQTSPKDDVNNRSTSCCGSQTSPKDDVTNRTTSCCGNQTSPKENDMPEVIVNQACHNYCATEKNKAIRNNNNIRSMKKKLREEEYG